jgi:hypothetical protein
MGKILRQLWQSVERSFCPPKFKPDVLTLNIPEVYQALTYELELCWWIGP